jgi:hypothetical protein
MNVKSGEPEEQGVDWRIDDTVGGKDAIYLLSLVIATV